MPTRAIVHLPAKVLRSQAKEVPTADILTPAIRTLIRDMKLTLANTTDGVGLAAPQVGEALRIFLVSEEATIIDKPAYKADSEKTNWKQFVFINPTLVRHSRQKAELVEGCLSVPNQFGAVARYEKVELRWWDEQGKKHSRGFAGFYARVIQHELDHLEGRLIVDRARAMVSLADLKKR